MKVSIIVGITVGMILSAFVLAIDGLKFIKPAPVEGSLLPDNKGEIKELVIHYTPEAVKLVGNTYRDFLSKLDSKVVVHVVVPEEKAFEELLEYLGPKNRLLNPVIVNHKMTTWARDRWLSLASTEGNDEVTLLSPYEERLAHAWPLRAEDGKIGKDLSLSLSGVNSLRSDLFFDGGDFVSDEETVFVTPDVFLRNFHNTVKTREELIKRLEKIVKRKVILLRSAPKHHAGMFMMVTGEKTLLVSSPLLGKDLLVHEGVEEVDLGRFLPGGADFSEETINLYDTVAKQARLAGYRVIRIPSLHGLNSNIYISYTNVIIDNPKGKRVVYLPVYDGLEALNEMAKNIWKGLDYEVRTVDSTKTYREGGTIRCLVNILRRR